MYLNATTYGYETKHVIAIYRVAAFCKAKVYALNVPVYYKHVGRAFSTFSIYREFHTWRMLIKHKFCSRNVTRTSIALFLQGFLLFSFRRHNWCWFLFSLQFRQSLAYL